MSKVLEAPDPSPAVEPIESEGARGSSSGRGSSSVLRWSLWLSLALALLFLAGYLPRRAQRERLLAGVGDARSEPLQVSVVRPKLAGTTRVLKLPATLEPSEQTIVYARAQGYARRWLVDLGEPVREGQLLCELDTPELDRELLEARAGLAQSAAGVTLARAARDFTRETLARYTQLTDKNLTSKQELSQHQAESSVNDAKVEVAEAAHTSQVARVQRLEQLKAFSKVYAPFAGVITARTVERGALVSAGAGSPLFEIASVEPLRVDLHVPQSQIAGIARGQAAKLSVAEHPGRLFEAVVARTSERLDPKTRTLRVELTVKNEGRPLLPGMYATVELSLESTRERLLVPANALLHSKDGTKLALVRPDGRIALTRVEVERDLGAELEIASGLRSTDDVVVSPSPGLADGTAVKASPSAPRP